MKNELDKFLKAKIKAAKSASVGDASPKNVKLETPKQSPELPKPFRDPLRH